MNKRELLENKEVVRYEKERPLNRAERRARGERGKNKKKPMLPGKPVSRKYSI